MTFTRIGPFGRCVLQVAVLVSLLWPRAVAATAGAEATAWEISFVRYMRMLDERIERDVVQFLRERESGRELEIRLAGVHEFRRALRARGEDFLQRYRVLFAGAPATPEVRQLYATQLANDEAGFVKALDAGLETLREMAEWRGSAHPRESEWSGLERRLQAATSVLQRPGEVISNPLIKDLNLVMPTARAKFVVPYRYVADTVVLGRRLFEHMQRLPDHTFSRADSREALRYVGFDLSGAPRNAIFVLAFSHDYAMFDVMMAERVAARLGDASPGLLTVERSWPHYKLGRARERNVVFIEDGDPIRRLTSLALDRSSSSPEGRRVVSIAPEGQVPYFHARFPPITKSGAFVLARRLSIEASAEANGSRPVYVLPVFSNAMEHLSSTRGAPLTVTVGQPVLVPTEPLSRQDAWVESMRRQFEEATLRHRGLQMADLSVRSFVPGSRVPIATPRLPAIHGVRCESLFSPVVSPML
ncbi:MAG TPA: hypothetical protein PLZ57_02250 [Pseudobdellovibrionaceae bacterium]|nr:hypothetical protein [Pseudobdellovibrionaceae bacterium]